MADFIQTFRQLDVHQRRHFLARLPAELTPYEWRDLHAITSTRSFYTDIIGRLPIELVAYVFSFLDPAAPYRCQSVSRRWHHVLRSLNVLKAPLNSWYQGAIPLRDADYASCVQTASSIQRFRSGRPVSVYKIALDKHMAAPSLFGDHLIWMGCRQKQSRMAYILNLHTWQLRYLAGEARELLLGLAASDQIVMLSTATNTCYVFELDNIQPPKKFSLPSRQFLRYVACHGHTVACVASYEMHTSVFIWDYRTQQGTSFDIRHGPDSVYAGHNHRKVRHIALTVQPETETISLLFIVGDLSATQPLDHALSVISVTYTFRGECVSSSCPSLPDVDQMIFWPGKSLFVPADDSNTLFTLRLQVLKGGHDPSSSRSGTLVLQFNAKTYELSVLKGLGPRSHNLPIRFDHSVAWWKDTCYGFKVDTDIGDMVAYMGTCDTEAYVPIVSEPKKSHNAHEVYYSDPLLVNEKYVVRCVPGSVYLACFHENSNSNRPTGEGTFFDMGELSPVVEEDSIHKDGSVS